MKFLKWTLAILGVGAVIALAVLLGQFALESRELIGAAQRYDSARAIRDPFESASLIGGVGVAAGLLLGLGLGLPNRTANQIRAKALEGQGSTRVELPPSAPSDPTAPTA